MVYPIPANEPSRLTALRAYDVVGTPPEMDFDEIAEVAAQVCGCPVAVINLVADKWEWYKGKCGIPQDVNREPRGGICSTTICGNDLLIVSDLTKDERFADQHMVKGEPHFRFYAGAPMINPDGYALGSLCVLDYEPRQIGAQQMEALRCLTHQAVAQLELRRKVAELDDLRRALAEEKLKAEDLLRNILPDDIAEELKMHRRVQPRYYDSVTILFTDFKGFTRLAESLEPRALIEELDEHFSAFDDIVTRHELEKLKTIGDAYMCVAGLPERTQTHALNACAAALDIRDYMARVNIARDKLRLPRWEIRIGLHTGGVIAGVVGKKKFTYDIWGDAMNVAALMEAQAEPGQIVLSDSTFNRVRGRFETEFRNEIDTAKKGRIRCHVLRGPLEESPQLSNPTSPPME
jgi:adenylate cyclase